MRRWTMWLGIGLGVVLFVALWCPGRARPSSRRARPIRCSGRRAPARGTVEIVVVSNGYHAGVALPRAALAEFASGRGYPALIAVAQRFAAYRLDRVRLGRCANSTGRCRRSATCRSRLALRALFWPGNVSVLHVVGLSDDPVRAFRSAELVRVPLSTNGLRPVARPARRTRSCRRRRARCPISVRGLYGPSLFYPANGTFSILQGLQSLDRRAARRGRPADRAGARDDPGGADVRPALARRTAPGLAHARRDVNRPRPIKSLLRAALRPPYRDEEGRKGWFERISRAQPHLRARLDLTIPGWPKTSRPLRIAFLSDFHAGSHAGDVARLAAIVAEAQAFKPDLVLHGGDFVNMQLFGGGRLPPRIIAAILARLDAPLGRFAVLGNHDYTYGADEVAAALQDHGITVLNDERRTLRHDGHDIDLIGLPDARELRPEGRALLRAARAADDRAGARSVLVRACAGGAASDARRSHPWRTGSPAAGSARSRNASRAPLRWSLRPCRGGRAPALCDERHRHQRHAAAHRHAAGIRRDRCDCGLIAARASYIFTSLICTTGCTSV